MTIGDATDDLPLVSVVMAVRDRPRLLAVALECYRQQTYPRRELLVVADDGRTSVDAAAVRAAGGRLIRVTPGTPPGTMLNLGVEVARGSLCQLIDADDWYAPSFLRTMMTAVLQNWRIVSRPTVAYLAPFLTFDLPCWEVGRASDAPVPGGSLLFQRENWRERPFRPIGVDVASTLLRDHLESGCVGLPVRGIDQYLAAHWDDHGPERDDTGSAYGAGAIAEDTIHALDRYGLGDPESIVPDWTLRIYRELHREIVAQPLI